MEKKYELLEDDTIIHNGVKLYRIRALRSFSNVNEEDLGGYIEKEYNLSHMGDCWVYDNAKVYNDARVYNRAAILDNAEVGDNASISGNAMVYDNAAVLDNAEVFGDALIFDRAMIFENANIFEDAMVFEDARVSGNAYVYRNSEVCGNVEICGDAVIKSDYDWLYVHEFNLNRRVVSFFKISTGDNLNDSIGVKCGCFTGTLREFKNAVRVKYGWFTEEARIYLKLARLVKLHFKKYWRL